ncbi:MAG: Uma2 family endonuclease [Myxococcota bacterium]
MANASVTARAKVALHLVVEAPPARWLLDEEDVPETPLHQEVIRLLVAVLQHWIATSQRDALVTSNLGCRWQPDDARVGMDPDVVLIEPAPPEGERLATLRVWEPGHTPPRLAVEVVSEATARKDYLDGAARCARLGVSELWVFDPLGVGPDDTGGPFPLQVWRRDDKADPAAMRRVYAGPGPARSEVLNAWIVVTEAGTRLRVADRPHDTVDALWPTEGEAETQRADTEAQKAYAEAQRADAEARKAQAEAQRAQAEAQRADAEARNAQAEAERADAAEAELARLRAQLADRDRSS